MKYALKTFVTLLSLSVFLGTPFAQAAPNAREKEIQWTVLRSMPLSKEVHSVIQTRNFYYAGAALDAIFAALDSDFAREYHSARNAYLQASIEKLPFGYRITVPGSYENIEYIYDFETETSNQRIYKMRRVDPNAPSFINVALLEQQLSCSIILE